MPIHIYPNPNVEGMAVTNKIVTYTGKTFDLINPSPNMICIEDIAHALANICRYTGHVSKFYSVAQHCVLMAESDLPGNSLVRLLHDSAEAYIGDISRPWKQNLHVADFNRPISIHESGILYNISIALGFSIIINLDIKEADNRMMATEIRDLMRYNAEFDPIINNYKPLPDKIISWEPLYAESRFLQAYYNLCGDKSCQES